MRDFLAKKVLGDLKGKTVGVVGAGEMGELAAQHLQKAGASRFLDADAVRTAMRDLIDQRPGAFGGAVQNPANALAKIISQLSVLELCL